MSIKYFGIDNHLPRPPHPGDATSPNSEENNRELVTLVKEESKPRTKRVEFEDAGAPEGQGILPMKGAPEETNEYLWDSNRYALTDENHNDLRMLMNVTVQNFFMLEENSKYAVFFLRPRCLTQRSLVNSQEASLGAKKTAESAGSKKSDGDIIKSLIVNFEKTHPGIKTYKGDMDIPELKTNFVIDVLNFTFNVMIFFLMAYQLFLYLDINLALLKQNWSANSELPKTLSFDSIHKSLQDAYFNAGGNTGRVSLRQTGFPLAPSWCSSTRATKPWCRQSGPRI
jgi:hypothetical protein